jgi:hypothetical protein
MAPAAAGRVAELVNASKMWLNSYGVCATWLPAELSSWMFQKDSSASPLAAAHRSTVRARLTAVPGDVRARRRVIDAVRAG